MQKIVIVGGVAGGATAAARARRLEEDAKIVIFERGEYISFANCGLPYYIGGVITERDALLVTTEESFSSRYNVDIRSMTEVTGIDREKKEVTVRDVRTGMTSVESYDRLILSPGAEPFRPEIKGLDLPGVFTLRNIPDTDRIKRYVDAKTPKTALVAGAGFIGLEMAENLVERGVETTVVELTDQIMPPLDVEMAAAIETHVKSKGTTVLTSTTVQGIEAADGAYDVVLQNGSEPETRRFDLVLLATGVRPETSLALSADLAMSEKGGVRVDASMMTSDPAILATGDAVTTLDYVSGAEVVIPLAGPANRQGRIAADNASGRRSVYKGTLGTSIAKIFDMNAASTGMSEKRLKADNIPYKASWTHSGSHAGYYPGAEMMAIKLLFAPNDGKVLGAQIVGGKGVDKRIDVIATAIKAGMTVFDLQELELAYAPPFSSAKDPVNIAGYVAGNILMGDVEMIDYTETLAADSEKDLILDVRTDEEIEENGTLDHVLHIPVDQIRNRCDEIDKSKRILVLCAIGLRGYLGYRILKHRGYDVKAVAGGYATLRHMR
ncbi:FAD-dependent oxidoreductase [Desulfoluna spongiiphila]|uniref:NADPH-dependent 2,4-dienoyl-CoA reductase, sulfur reductase n=1 Tax=Desulfoluna spongiiphila TaxID=419481 RepID=A0A1G5EYS6_9BACT|nr:FAD-dependent oxidoreductase [Desulfoluna spongiiphila]SCY32123.1 NADPH-dependent 2,4-dienoyl-CoA reductase, sulfur reductase [Desulfoluna spongiiphila]VVS94437.1 pyridine nucleotide disulphide reductase class-i signature [Desulfoluna spongiiphila]